MSTHFVIINDPETIDYNIIKLEAASIEDARNKFVKYYFRLFYKMNFTYADVETLLGESNIYIHIVPENAILDTLVESCKS